MKPFASLKTITNWVYYGLDQFPQQTAASTLVTRLGGDLDFNVRTSSLRRSGFHFDNEIYFTTTSGSSAETIQIPALFYNGRHYWAGNAFKQTVPLQVGFGLHAKSAYFANAYNPMLQQFYLQQDQKLPQFVAIDFFLNMRVEKIFLCLKVTHANQPGDGGYFVTPDYPGQQRSIDLGIKWMFFD